MFSPVLPGVGAGARPADTTRRRGISREAAVGLIFTLVIGMLVALSVLFIDLLSAARAYIGGESLWSKGQKSAVQHLLVYAETRDESAWAQYRTAIAIPLADRQAREALDRPLLDEAAVRQGFVGGGIHPDDVPGMVRLYRWFGTLPFMRRVILTWSEGDERIAELTTLAHDLHRQVAVAEGLAALRASQARLRQLDDQLTALEVRFSTDLAEAARIAELGFTLGLVLIACTLVSGALLFTHRQAVKGRHYEAALRASEEALRRANEQLEQRVDARTAELSDANDKLRSLDRLKSEFLATITHELRTPLNAILGFSALLRDGHAGPITANQQRKLGMVHASGERLLSLINDLLDVSRIEAGRMELHHEPFDLADVIDELAATLQPAADAKQLALHCSCAQRPLPMHGDRLKCLQVLLLVARNAVKFTAAGRVMIEADVQAGDARIRTSDTGIGIAPQQLPLLFEAFRQLDSGLRRAHEGVGLGLYLCRQLVTLMGGTIDVQSVPGEGSCFTVRLPLHIDSSSIE
jgi:signal transduction histidine kinase